MHHARKEIVVQTTSKPMLDCAGWEYSVDNMSWISDFVVYTIDAFAAEASRSVMRGKIERTLMKSDTKAIVLYKLCRPNFTRDVLVALL